jgi:hypothetical protein
VFAGIASHCGSEQHHKVAALTHPPTISRGFTNLILTNRSNKQHVCEREKILKQLHKLRKFSGR